MRYTMIYYCILWFTEINRDTQWYTIVYYDIMGYTEIYWDIQWITFEYYDILMTGSKISTSCKIVKVNPWWRQSGVFYFRTELSDFNQFETRLFAWKWKWCGFVLIFWICSFDCFYLQYLKRSRLTWKCSSMQIYQIMKKSL